MVLKSTACTDYYYTERTHRHAEYTYKHYKKKYKKITGKGLTNHTMYVILYTERQRKRGYTQWLRRVRWTRW